MKYLGIDSCKGGWFTVALDEIYKPTFCLLKNILQVIEKFSDFNLALIDIPICMADTGFRQCDILGRKYLGKRSSTIFTVPVRRGGVH